MQENRLGSFHTELLNYLYNDVQKRIEVEDFGNRSNPKFQDFLNEFTSDISEKRISVDEIVDQYQTFVGKAPSQLIEQELMEAFPVQDFIDLNLSRYYPRIYRGLPRLYQKDNPTKSGIKKSFTDLPSLKKQAVSKSLFSLYSHLQVSGKVTLFTWVLPDGMGDYTAAIEIMRLLKGKMPYLDLELVAVAKDSFIQSLPKLENVHLIGYDGKELPEDIGEEAYRILRSSDVILQTPTYYPKTFELMEKLKGMNSDKPIPKIEFLGEYGFLESRWFHPQSSGYSMGLHFLEKGILTRKKIQASIEDIQHEKLKNWIVKENHLFLAYLSTRTGGAIYLHALLKSLEEDATTIDICTPNISWFLEHVEHQKAIGQGVLEWDLNVASIDLYVDEKIHSINIAPIGKKVRIYSTGALSQSDFRVLLDLSGEWVAVRGNQSFSEAISQGKVFFYDGREHSRYFVKDLLAISENRIYSYQGTLACIRGIAKAVLYNTSVQESNWVDESYFQPIDDWSSIAMELGLALTDPKTIEGFQKLNSVLVEEFSCNSFIFHLIKRALCHHHYPLIEKLENEELSLFITGGQTFFQFIQAQRDIVKNL